MTAIRRAIVLLCKAQIGIAAIAMVLMMLQICADAALRALRGPRVRGRRATAHAPRGPHAARWLYPM